MSKWISVLQALPTKNGPYLVYAGIVLVAWYYRETKCFEVPSGRKLSASDRIITHWAPLPEPPKGE